MVNMCKILASILFIIIIVLGILLFKANRNINNYQNNIINLQSELNTQNIEILKYKNSTNKSALELIEKQIKQEKPKEVENDCEKAFNSYLELLQ